MKFFATITVFIAALVSAHAELPTSGFRAVAGGRSPDGRWIVCVLDSSAFKFVDELPESHQNPYLVDLDKMRAVTRIADVDALGGYHGRPETNVTAKWFSDSKLVSIGSRTGRLNHDFSIFEVSPTGDLRKVTLPSPLKEKSSLFNKLKPHSNCGNYLQSITPKGEVIVVYYGYQPVEEGFYNTPTGKLFDRNRIEVVYKKNGDQWVIVTIASPGTHGEQGIAPNDR